MNRIDILTTGVVVRLVLYSLVTLWVLIVGAAVADRYGLSAGYVAIFGFLLCATFICAVVNLGGSES